MFESNKGWIETMLTKTQRRPGPEFESNKGWIETGMARKRKRISVTRLNRIKVGLKHPDTGAQELGYDGLNRIKVGLKRNKQRKQASRINV